MLTDAQRALLLRPIPSNRVAKDGKGFAHVESYEIIAHLTRVFGFEGWDSHVIGGPDLIYETERPPVKDKERWDVAYRATVRLVVRDPEGWTVIVKEDSATGEALNQSRGDAHDLALKSAVSTAEKRAARKLGDQFGLSLYNSGSLSPCVVNIPIYDPPTDSDDPATFVDREGRWVGYASPPEVPPDLPTQTSATMGRIADSSRKRIYAVCKKLQLDPLGVAAEVLGYPVEHLTTLTPSEGKKINDSLTEREKLANAQ
jgi:hypothetical protein